MAASAGPMASIADRLCSHGVSEKKYMGFTIIRDLNIATQIVGSRYHEDPNKVP